LQRRLTIHNNYCHVLEKKVGRNSSLCHCPPSCKKVEFDATISTSHLSELLVDSLVAAEKEITDIRERFLRARKVRAWVDKGRESAVDIVLNMRRLVGAIGNLRSVVDINLVNESTSIVRVLMRNIVAIVQRTTDELLTFRRRVTNVVTAPDGCVTQLADKVKTFGDYGKSVDEELKKIALSDDNDSQLFKKTFARYVERVFHEFMLRNFSDKGYGLMQDVDEMCFLESAVKRLSMLMPRHDTCDVTSFCSDYRIRHLTRIKFESNKFYAMHVKTKNGTEPTFSFEKVTTFVNWLLEISEDDPTDGLGLIKPDPRALKSIRNALRLYRDRTYAFLLSTPSIFDVQRCNSDMENWLADLQSWLKRALSLNDTAARPSTIPVSSARSHRRGLIGEPADGATGSTNGMADKSH